MAAELRDNPRQELIRNVVNHAPCTEMYEESE
jgi:hypothetical protein